MIRIAGTDRRGSRSSAYRRGLPRGWRAGRLLAALVLTAVAAACSEDATAPESTDEGGAGGAQLATNPEKCTAEATGGPLPGGLTMPELIDRNFPSGSIRRTTIRTKCASVLRTRSLDTAIAAIEVIERHSIAPKRLQIKLANAFLCLTEGKPAGGPGCDLKIPTQGYFNVVPPEGTGGPVDAGDGFSAYNLKPGWSEVSRIVTYAILSDEFQLDFEGPQFPKYRRYGTIPSGPFAFPGAGIIFQCVIDEADLDPSTLRLAKNFEAPDDPLGINVQGIEYFESPPPSESFSPPQCEEETEVSGAVMPSSATDAAAIQSDGKKGGSTIGLAATRKSIGGTVSSFSEWGFVQIEQQTTVQGVVTEDSCSEGCIDPVPGAEVDLACTEDANPDNEFNDSTTTSSDGEYLFAPPVEGFGSGWTCDVFASDGEGKFGGETGVELQDGINEVDIFIEFSA